MFQHASGLLKKKPEMFIILVTDNSMLKANQKVVGKQVVHMEQLVLRYEVTERI